MYSCASATLYAPCLSGLVHIYCLCARLLATACWAKLAGELALKFVFRASFSFEASARTARLLLPLSLSLVRRWFSLRDFCIKSAPFNYNNNNNNNGQTTAEWEPDGSDTGEPRRTSYLRIDGRKNDTAARSSSPRRAQTHRHRRTHKHAGTHTRAHTHKLDRRTEWAPFVRPERAPHRSLYARRYAPSQVFACQPAPARLDVSSKLVRK